MKSRERKELTACPDNIAFLGESRSSGENQRKGVWDREKPKAALYGVPRKESKQCQNQESSSEFSLMHICCLQEK